MNTEIVNLKFEIGNLRDRNREVIRFRCLKFPISNFKFTISVMAYCGITFGALIGSMV